MIRTLAYDFLKEKYPVFYLRCGETSFKGTELAEEINRLSGIIIVEDIHLAPSEANEAYCCLQDSDMRNVIFTGRSSFREALQRQNELLYAPTKDLETFSYADDLITFFLDQNDCAYTKDDIGKLKAVSTESYWLLAYALKGFIKKEGKGKKEEWIGEEVKSDLEDLGKVNPAFPEILVALSPLYMNEVHTAAKFLINEKNGLGYRKQDIYRLFHIGEIIQVEEEWGFCYGLPHSTLADVYWKYGKPYLEDRGIPNNIEDFIYEYASSEAPNSLVAFVQGEKLVMENLFFRLAEGGRLGKLIEKSDCWASISILVREIPGECCSAKLMRSIGHKVNFCSRGSDLGRVFLQLWQRKKKSKAMKFFWEMLDFVGIAQKVTSESTVMTAAIITFTIGELNPPESENFWDNLDYKKLAEMVYTGSDMFDGCFFVGAFLGGEKYGAKLCEELDFVKLSTKMELLGLGNIHQMVIRNCGHDISVWIENKDLKQKVKKASKMIMNSSLA